MSTELFYYLISLQSLRIDCRLAQCLYGMNDIATDNMQCSIWQNSTICNVHEQL